MGACHRGMSKRVLFLLFFVICFGYLAPRQTGRVLRTASVLVSLLLSTYQGSINDKSIFSTSSTRSVSLLCLQKYTNTVRRVIFVLHLGPRVIHPCLFGSRATISDTPSKSIRLFMSTVSLETSIVKCVFLIYHEHKTNTIYHSLWTLHTHDQPQILETLV